MSATSRILIEYGTSLRAVCAHSLFVMSLTHWFSSGSVTTTVESVICLSYSLPMAISLAVFSASEGDGMLAHSIAMLTTVTTVRRNGIMATRSSGGGDRRAGSLEFAEPAELSTSAA